MVLPQVCPRCRGTHFLPTGPQSVRCTRCQLPIAIRAHGGGGTSWIAPVVIGAVVLALAIGGVVAWAIFSAQKQRARMIDDRDEMFARELRDVKERREAEERAAIPDPDPPVAKLGKAVTGQAAGTQFWLVPYTNVGTTPISRPHVAVTTFDGSGSRVAEEGGYARVDRLEPGAATVVLVVAQTGGAYTRFETSAGELRAATYEDNAPATVTEWRVDKAELGLPRIVGSVRNDRTGSLRFITVEAIGRNRAGEVVAYANSFAEDDDLAAHESSGFTLTVGVWQVEEPDAWELVASGRP